MRKRDKMKNSKIEFRKGDVVLIPLEYVHRGKSFNPHDQIKMVERVYTRTRTYIDEKGRAKKEKIKYLELHGHHFSQDLMAKEVTMFIPRRSSRK